MNLALLILVSVQTVIGLVELFITLDKKFKRTVEEIVHIPEGEREP